MCYEAVAPFYNAIAIQYPLYIVAPPPPAPLSLVAVSPRHSPPRDLVDDGNAMVEEEDEEDEEEGTGTKKDEIPKEKIRKEEVVIVPEWTDKVD